MTWLEMYLVMVLVWITWPLYVVAIVISGMSIWYAVYVAVKAVKSCFR